MDKMIFNCQLPLIVRIKGVSMLRKTLNSIDYTKMSSEQRDLLQMEMNKLLEGQLQDEPQLLIEVLLMMQEFYKNFKETTSQYHDGGLTFITNIVKMSFTLPVYLHDDRFFHLLKTESHLVMKHWNKLQKFFVEAVKTNADNCKSNCITQMKIALFMLESRVDLGNDSVIVDLLKIATPIFLETYMSLEDASLIHSICDCLKNISQKDQSFLDSNKESIMYLGVLQVTASGTSTGKIEQGLDLLLLVLTRSDRNKTISKMILKQKSLLEKFVLQLKTLRFGNSQLSRKAVVVFWQVENTIQNLLASQDKFAVVSVSTLQSLMALLNSTLHEDKIKQDVSVIGKLTKKIISCIPNEASGSNLANDVTKEAPSNPLADVSEASMETNSEDQRHESYVDDGHGETDNLEYEENDEPANKRTKPTLTNKMVVYDSQKKHSYIVSLDENRNSYYCDDCGTGYTTRRNLYQHIKMRHFPSFVRGFTTWPRDYGEPKIGSSYIIDGEEIYLKSVYDTRIKFHVPDVPKNVEESASTSFKTMLEFWNHDADKDKTSNEQSLKAMLTAPPVFVPTENQNQEEDEEDLKLLLNLHVKGKTPLQVEVVDLCSSGGFFQTLQKGANIKITSGVYLVLSQELVNKILNPVESAKKAFDELKNFFASENREFDNVEKRAGQEVFDDKQAVKFLSGGLLIVKLRLNEIYVLVNFSLVAYTVICVIGKLSQFVKSYLGI
ncbi:uncharacterized protein LOC132199025 [Neocloeon triangulifer]|uniref:uncharacterized protein LOC132199025 n=1 Tax=Neocloeon triangulifer TaxID=2078957 RepID=UPI00286EC406|nr:uncharacterized protein LOC132199025 [Neocloeon triangulifer]